MDCIDLARVRTTAAALVLIVIGLAVSTKNLSQEAAVSLQGDMPRYLMNGVYFHDVIKDQPWRRLLDYTREYYARYPALSIGHHPVLLPLAESAAFSVAGISVRSARGVIVLSLIACALGMFALLRTVYGDWLAMVSSLLLITSPIIVGFSRVVLSEMLTVTLVVMSVVAYHRYCERGTRLWLTAFVAAVAASLG